ncbi:MULTISPECIES: pyridoxamine 5'-phosphate oxidase family protein [Streptomyces]|uniref:Pyridoxamine 5'-phosphate oxidase-like FMN-binding protein n=2 Tax=Streptomyces TaxID=1883 RepID=A0A0B5EJW0_STRA4|nr:MULTISPECIES: pyridoxamine 5'-phosphate oxidase family protein [Streptomyces]AJE82578.1 pyridoxamine 5'-phosphate oxidase-like FMN- binding protein [Streptomyces albus]AOU76892.1 pyridoxamine 5'-phosphate oxidase-like FMN- binding protein [Streptomyces albus]AYN32670.1 pyridoxamine 5'-phosphate oxidase-like FMN- binding protein [Streptomyces albus]NKI39974.1 pyridoxamine 5'-phosphate oxidase family protein [Streptomyces physcomitrii]
MAAAKVRTFAEIEDKFVQYIQEIVYCTMITVDKKNRPRARVLLPIWETVDGKPVGWLAAYKTPVKVAHLANNPHTTYSYWSPNQNAVFVDSVSRWVDDPETKRYSWDLYRKGSPAGVGYNPLNFWRGGPEDPKYDVLRIEPWRVQVLRGTDLSSRIWTDESAA